MKQKVAIVLSVKNLERTVAECVNSLLKQNYKNFEIFILDGGSKDRTWDVLMNLWHVHQDKIQIFRKRLNLPAAYNFLIEKINEKEFPYIAFTDGDCIAEKNWLSNLIREYDRPDVIAVAGKVKTPNPPDNELQELIGRELENRYDKFPSFVSRAATMNLSVLTRYAKWVKFDERLEAVQETDWGYRLTKLGKMYYTELAVVRHRHRSTWKGFFKQQFRYGIYTPLLYAKHVGQAKGDHVSTSAMMVQPFLWMLIFITLLTSVIYSVSLVATIFLAGVLFCIWLLEIDKIDNSRNIRMYLMIFFVRSIAWSLGLVWGIFKSVKLLIKC